MIKILHIIVGLGTGGAELMLKRLVGLHRYNPNYQHLVISLTSMGDVGKQLQESGIDVYAIGMRSPLDIPYVLWRLIGRIRSVGPDIVQTWMYHSDLLGGTAARLAGNYKVIWGVRTTDIEGCSKSTAVVRKICAWLSRWVPHVIVCAAEASRQVHMKVGYDGKKMVVIPNGFDLLRWQLNLAKRNTLRIECGFHPDDMVVGSLGRFNSDKDQGNFIQAAGIIAKKHPYVRYLLVGRDLDTNNPVLMKWISQTGYVERFVLLGEREDVPECLSVMDVFCLHSRTEGFPNVVGEAMSMALPCVVTDVGDAALLVGDTGFVVPKENPIMLAQGIESILAITPDGRHHLGEKAKRRITLNYSMANTCERFEKVYEQLTKKRVH